MEFNRTLKARYSAPTRRTVRYTRTTRYRSSNGKDVSPEEAAAIAELIIFLVRNIIYGLYVFYSDFPSFITIPVTFAAAIIICVLIQIYRNRTQSE